MLKILIPIKEINNIWYQNGTESERLSQNKEQVNLNMQ